MNKFARQFAKLKQAIRDTDDAILGQQRPRQVDLALSVEGSQRDCPATWRVARRYRAGNALHGRTVSRMEKNKLSRTGTIWLKRQPGAKPVKVRLSGEVAGEPGGPYTRH